MYRNQYIQEKSTAKRIVTSPRLHDASLLGELEGTSWHTGSGFKGVSIFGLSTTFQPRPCEKNVWQSHRCSILSLQKNRAVPFLSPLKVITVYVLNKCWLVRWVWGSVCSIPPLPSPLNYSQGHQMIKKFKIYPPAGPFRQYHCSEHL